jgi:hypothetical protein
VNDSAPVPNPDPGPETAPRLTPLRDPRPFSVHWLLDSVMFFIAAFFVLWVFIGLGLQIVIAVSLLVGLAAAPVTRGYEARGLAARAAAHRNPENEQ